MEYMIMPLKRYADFQGRSRRKEYWMFALFIFLVSIVLTMVDMGMGTGTPTGFGILSGLFSLAILIPSIAVGVRRLHDTDRSGWWILIGLIPLIGAIVLLVFYVQDGTPGPNKFGASPKAEDTGAIFA
jgi:uncharacterized membrane protein YhaH (DUF805 family)